MINGFKPFVVLEASDYLTNETIFSLDRLPSQLAVVGGGPVGTEMAQAFGRLGAGVTIIQRSGSLLPADEPELVERLEKRLGAEGITLRIDTELVSVERSDLGLQLRLRHAGEEETLETERLLVAIGREPRIEGLGLDRAGVKTNERGIDVDDYCRTSQRHIFATGDVAGGPKFTHWAEHTSKKAIATAVLGVPSAVERDAIVWTTFTDPEVAHCGKRRAELEPGSYQLYRFPYDKLDRAVAQRRGEGMVQVYADGGRILGASAVGEAAGEIVGELAIAMRNGISLRQLADSLHAYPGWSLGARRVADQWYIQNTPVGLLRKLGKLRGLRGRVPDLDPDEIL